MQGKELYNQIAQALDTLQRASQTLRVTATEQQVIRIVTPPEFFATRRSDGTNLTVQQVYMALQANG
jgi:DNA-binding transcriptional LysR family regulator